MVFNGAAATVTAGGDATVLTTGAKAGGAKAGAAKGCVAKVGAAATVLRIGAATGAATGTGAATVLMIGAGRGAGAGTAGTIGSTNPSWLRSSLKPSKSMGLRPLGVCTKLPTRAVKGPVWGPSL